MYKTLIALIGLFVSIQIVGNKVEAACPQELNLYLGEIGEYSPNVVRWANRIWVPTIYRDKNGNKTLKNSAFKPKTSI